MSGEDLGSAPLEEAKLQQLYASTSFPSSCFPYSKKGECVEQRESEALETFTIFRFHHSLGKGIKSRIKSYGCYWNSLFHGWICPFSNQKEVEEILREAQIEPSIQTRRLPKTFIPTDPKIAGLETRLDILETEAYDEETQLLRDIYQYDKNLRPENFSEPPLEEGKSSEKFLIEKDFYTRYLFLQKKKDSIELARKELLHLHVDSGEKILDPEAPLGTVDALIQEHFFHNGCRTLHYCSDVFWLWKDTKYVELKDNALRQKVYSFLRSAKRLNKSGYLEDFNPTKFKIDQIIDALRAVCHHNHCPAEGAVWLDGRAESDTKNLIFFKNGILNMENRLLIAHTPFLMNTNSLNFDFNPAASIPEEWHKFLNDLWPEDIESQQTLQEWFGYFLIQDARLHKIFLLIGPPRSGKGTIGRILYELLGSSNVIGPTLSSLAGDFGLLSFLNKMLAIISDARISSKGQNIIIERLLSISGQDPLTIDRKYLSPITVQLPTRIMIMSNELPDLKDASGALWNRYVVLTLSKSWLGKEDSDLFNRLQKDLPGILLWALEGLSRLQRRGRFLQPSSSFSIIEELVTMTSPIQAFVKDRCEIKPQAMISAADLFSAWKEWCAFTGHIYSGTLQTFGKNLRAAFPMLEIARPQENYSRERCYRGISLISIPGASADVRGH
jgi:putative DNA primase/helicase